MCCSGLKAENYSNMTKYHNYLWRGKSHLAQACLSCYLAIFCPPSYISAIAFVLVLHTRSNRPITKYTLREKEKKKKKQ